MQEEDTESNGKSMTQDRVELDFKVEEVHFGGPRTLEQHSELQCLQISRSFKIQEKPENNPRMFSRVVRPT